MTEAERWLWKALRGKRLEGLKFRRQQPIDPFIVDFVCFEKKLVIEADGGQHFEGEQKEKDLDRDRWLREQGFEVLRFSNSEIMTSTDGVITRILEHTIVSPSVPGDPSPSKGEGGGVAMFLKHVFSRRCK